MNVKKTIAVAISMVLITLTSPLSLTADNSASAETEIWDGTCDTSWYDEEEKELHISTAEELAGLSELVNAGKEVAYKTIYLDNDIYLNDISDFANWGTEPPENIWTPISVFSGGTLDGNGHTIYGAYIAETTSNIKGSTEYIGFIKECNGGIINLNFENLYISTSQTGWTGTTFNGVTENSNLFCVGGISGYCRSWISNCTVNGMIKSESYASRYGSQQDAYLSTVIGAIAGKNEGTILQCINKAQINASSVQAEQYAGDGYLYAGGICGSGSGSISECKNSGTIILECDTRSKSYAAGICGCILYSSELSDCYNEGTFGADITSGIIGYLRSDGSSGSVVSINRVYNIGTTQDNTYLTTGIIGTVSLYDDLTIEDAYYLNTTAVSGMVDISGSSDIDSAISKSSSNMQAESFAESLGEAFVYNEGGYPLLAWEVELQQELLMGDVNLDGIFDVADIKLLQDYLVCRETLTAEQGAVADVCTDGILDVFDLCILKRMYLEKSETA